MHRFKRWYLLATTLASFLIPLVLFTEYAVVPASSQNTIRAIQEISAETMVTRETSTNYLPILVWGVYAVGALIFGINFLKNLFAMLQRIRKNPKYKAKNCIWVLLSHPTIPHTFFNYIFLNRKKFEKKEIPDAVLLHEEAHARQRHSLDVLCVELLHVFLWFNPLIIALKRAIKLNHEFLADQAVVEAGISTKTYQSLILDYSSFAFSPTLANSLHYSSTRLRLFGTSFTVGPSAFAQVKKRISVMKTETSRKSILIRSVLLLPLTAALLFGFSEKQIVYKKTESQELIKEKATPSDLKEYNTLAKKYNAIPIENRAIPFKELQKLETIYKRMSVEQRANAEAFPECLPKKTSSTAKKEYVAFVGPVIPPVPNPNPVVYIQELAQKGAVFFIGPHQYSPEEVIELVRKSSKEISIDVSKYPEVHLGGC